MILAIDQSTSASKAILFDAAGRILDKAARPHRQHYPKPGWVEHDAGEIWANVVAVAREIAGRNDLAKLAGVSVTNQRETFVVFDRATGAPLHNAIVWQDRRGDAICRELARHNDVVRRKTGLKIDGYFSASKIKWLLADKHDLAARLRDGTAVVGTIDAYLVHRLTGGRTVATDSTNASRTLLYDIDRLAWDDELCALFDVPPRALPEVRESAASYGETDVGGALPRAVPLCGVIGDSQAALFAQRCFAPGDTKATFGTGTSVMVNAGHAFPRVGDGGSVAALAWTHGGQPTYALEGLINYSSATLAWLKDQLGLFKDDAEIDALAGSVPDAGGVFLVPAFAGLGAPHWRDDARAAIVGMTAFSTRAHVVRAAVESIAYQIRDALDMIARDGGVRPTLVNADGGPTRSALLMQLVADVTGVELVATDVPEASALGAASMGLLGLGIVKDLDALAKLPRDARRFAPAADRSAVERAHAGWRDAVRRVL